MLGAVREVPLTAAGKRWYLALLVMEKI